MNEFSKYWVRIPIGSNEEHREKYIEDFLSISLRMMKKK